MTAAPAWEVLDREQPFEVLTDAEQITELRAAVGLLVESLREILDANGSVRFSDVSFPLMPRTLQQMGYRYGPWNRG